MLALGDPDNNNRDGIFASFPTGLWTSPNGNNAFVRLDPSRGVAVTVGDFDNDGRDDIVSIFTSGTNLEVRMNNAGPFKPMKAPPNPQSVMQNAVAAALD